MIGPQIKATRRILATKLTKPVSSIGSQRYFSAAAADDKAPPLEDRDEEVVSNAYKNQHIVYVPRKKLSFNVKTPDGNMALIFESGEKSFDSRVTRWYKALGITLPGIAAVDMMQVIDPQYLAISLPFMLFPSLYFCFDSLRIKFAMKNEVRKMWLLQNGAQIVMETYDGLLHKSNIIDNEQYKLINTKPLVFGMEASGRTFMIACKNPITIDYELLDRIVKAVNVDTTRSTQVFHHLINKKIPSNLKPLEMNKFYPTTTLLFSTSWTWRILNRTMYRPDCFWLRDNTNKVVQTEVQQKLHSLTGLKNLNVDKFYQRYKITVTDFVEKVEKDEKLAEMVWSEGPGHGRRKIMQLKKIQEVTRKKIMEKERMHKFATKFMDEGITKDEVRQTGFFRSDLLY